MAAVRWGKPVTLDYNGTTSDYIKKVLYGILSYTIFICYQYISPLHTLWIILLKPLSYISLDLYLNLEAFGFRWLLYLVSSWQYHQQYIVQEVGTDIRQFVDEPSIFISNHQSTADVFTIMYLLSHHGAISRVMWIQDMILKYTHFGPISYIHGDFYLEQKDVKSFQMGRLVRHIQESFIPTKKKWVLLFPEGGFLRKRRQRSQEFAKKNGHPVLDNVVLPRIGALETVLTTLPTKPKHQNGTTNGVSSNQHSESGAEPLKWLIDTTIGYPDNLDLNAQTIIGGMRNPCKITIHHRVFPIEELPTDTESLLKWMYDRYVEKDTMLEIFHKTGKFPEWNEKSREVNKDVLLDQPRILRHCEFKIAAMKIFYLVLLYLTVSIFAGPALQGKVFTISALCIVYHIICLIYKQVK